MNSEQLENQEPIKLQWSDYLLKYTLLPLFPYFIKPNHVTIFRFMGTPFVLLLLYLNIYDWGIVLFLILALSDSIDGSLARTRQQITDWGKLYDPLADKFLIGSVVFLFVMQHLGWVLAVVIVIIELVFIMGGWYRHKHGIAVQANFWGKIKMFCQVCGVTLLLLAVIFSWPSLIPVAADVLYIAIVFAIVSLFSRGI